MLNRDDFPHPYRPLSDQEKLDIKRINGQSPCAECKRTKRKCDKKRPCTPCGNRGNGSICPTGTLTTWAGKNLILSDTTILHQKINAMASRIHQLEDALAVLQIMVSPHETHPLLREELLAIKSHLDNNIPSGAQEDAVTQELSKALGTLSINEDGHVKYFGPSAGSETLLSGIVEQQPPVNKDRFFLNLSISPPADLINNTILRKDDPLGELVSLLPPKPRAWSLIETFFEHTWAGSVMITRQDIINEYITPTYIMKAAMENGGNIHSKDTVSQHKLALVYILFGLGALVDLTLPPFSDEAEHYYDLALVALSSRSLFSSPELATIQTLTLCALYHMQGGQNNHTDGVWMFVSVASKLAQSIGLHRESSQWNLKAALTERRRKVFWGLFTLDTYLSLSVGRPPSFQLGYVDCEFPVDNEETIDANGVHRPGPFHLMYHLTKNISSAVIEAALTVKTPPYKTILDLDQKLREYCLEAAIDIDIPSTDTDTPLKFMNQNGLVYVRASTTLFLHRGFFAQAMLEHPSDPLRSPYAPSFLACYRCACDVIQLNTKNFTKFPSLIIRWRSFWSTLFAAAVIVGTICTRIQNVTMARQAFAELSTASRLFEYGASIAPRARSGLIFLRKLMNKATEVLSTPENNLTSPRVSDSVHDPHFGIDELQTYGGYTKVVQSMAKQEVGPSLHPLDNNVSWNSRTILVPSLLAMSPQDLGHSGYPSIIPRHALTDPPAFGLSTTNDLPNSGYSHIDPTNFGISAPAERPDEPLDTLLPADYPMDCNMLGVEEDPIFNAQWTAFMQSLFNENGEGERTNME